MNIITLPETYSTNTWLEENDATLPHLTIVRAVNQTAGRGQRGNSWESEAGKNLTFSVLLRPLGFQARNQFYISEAFSLAVIDALREIGVEARIKWPNDIYVEDRKICGILIEHSVMGMEITRSICGAGINVNQATFRSDAPNPVSVIQLKGVVTPLEEFMRLAGEKIEERLTTLSDSPDKALFHEEYMQTLWRAKDFHPYIDVATGEHFEAEITGIGPLGHLHLKERGGLERVYAFKEVKSSLTNT